MGRKRKKHGSTGFPKVDKYFEQLEEERKKEDIRRNRVGCLQSIGTCVLLVAGLALIPRALDQHHEERWNYLRQLADTNQNQTLESTEEETLWYRLDVDSTLKPLLNIIGPVRSDIERVIQIYEFEQCTHSYLFNNKYYYSN